MKGISIAKRKTPLELRVRDKNNMRKKVEGRSEN